MRRDAYQLFASLDILICHWQSALLRNVESVQVRRPHTQPLDIRCSQVAAIIGHVHATCSDAQTHEAPRKAWQEFNSSQGELLQERGKH